MMDPLFYRRPDVVYSNRFNQDKYFAVLSDLDSELRSITLTFKLDLDAINVSQMSIHRVTVT